MSDRCLVTGGAGFVGSHLVEHLLASGRKVTVFDDFSTGKRDNLAGLRGNLELVEGSLLDQDALRKAATGARAIAHLAALPSVARSLDRPLDSHAVNATGTLHVLIAAVEAKARLVYSGSSSAYGDHQGAVKHEELRESPLSPYAASKLAGELYCRAFARVHGLPVVVTRFFNVFGPRQTADSPYSGVVAAFCHSLLRNERPRIDGDGSQSRDFTYVGDVVEGVRLALDADTTGCETLNLAYGSSCTVLELYERLAEIAGRRPEPRFGPPRKGDVQHSLADVRRAAEKIGFRPTIGFAEGLQRTFDWYRRQHP